MNPIYNLGHFLEYFFLITICNRYMRWKEVHFFHNIPNVNSMITEVSECDF